MAHRGSGVDAGISHTLVLISEGVNTPTNLLKQKTEKGKSLDNIWIAFPHTKVMAEK